MKNGHVGPLTLQHCQMQQAIAPPILHLLEFCLFFQLHLCLLDLSQEKRSQSEIYLCSCSQKTVAGSGELRGGRSGNVLLLFKFVLHHIASYKASKFGSYVTKVDVGNESLSRELWSSPHLMPMDEKSMKKLYPNVP